MHRLDLMKRMWVTRRSINWPMFWQFWLIELATLNKWTWSYRSLNCARLDANERCESLLSTSGGLRWRCRQNCSNEALKLNNLVSHDWNTIVQEQTFFSCIHTQRLLNGFLSRVYNIYLKIKRLEMNSRPLKP